MTVAVGTSTQARGSFFRRHKAGGGGHREMKTHTLAARAQAGKDREGGVRGGQRTGEPGGVYRKRRYRAM